MLPYPIATGQKTTQLTNSDAGEGSRRDYAGSFVYVNNELAWVNSTHGRVVVNRDDLLPPAFVLEKEFHVRDHLGNTRVVLRQRKMQGDYAATHIADYYPFGMEIQRGTAHIQPPSGNLLNNRYLYNSKELQDDFGLDWYDYGARFYDAQIAPSQGKSSQLPPFV